MNRPQARSADRIRRGRGPVASTAKTLLHNSIAAIGMAALLAASAFAQETVPNSETRYGDSVEPFSTDSDLLGSTAAAPFVTVNEFTGKVSIQLPAIGVDGLNLTPSYVAPNRQELDELDSFPYREEYQRSPLGTRFIAASLRRISRDSNPCPGAQEPQAPVFDGCGTYVLHQPNGGRIEFKTTADIDRDDFTTYVYAYPAHVYEPNGRELEIVYLGGEAGLLGNVRPLIDYVEDSFGRRLRLSYKTVSGRKYIDQAFLQEGEAAGQVLATFDYEVHCDPEHGCDVHLRSITTAEGHRTLLGLEDPDGLPPGQPFPFVNRLTLPQGGPVRLDYTEIAITKEVPPDQSGCHSKYNCNNPVTFTKDEKWVRVARLEHSGGAFTFHYSQLEADAIERPEDWTRNDEYPLAPLTVTVAQVEAPPGEKLNSRKTTYFGFPTSHGQYIENSQGGNGLLIGRRALRMEEYCDRDDAYRDRCPERKEERWVYTSETNLCGEGFCRGLHFVTGGSANAGKTWLPLLRKYSDLIYPTTIERAHVPPPNSPPSTTACAAFPILLEQTFEYQHEHGGRQSPETPVPDAFALGLTTRGTLEAGGLVQQEIAAAYSNATWPAIPTKITRKAGSGNAIATDITYYAPSHLYAGLPRRRTTGGSDFGDAFKEYAYGVPSRIYPVAGLTVAPPTVREVNLDGTLASERKNGVELVFAYDQDRRPTETFFPSDLPQRFEYSPPHGQTGATGPSAKPGLPLVSEGCGDNWSMSAQANRQRRECLDPWGREMRTETLVTSQMPKAVAQTEYNAVGLPWRSIGPDGAVKETGFDVWGRPVSTVTYDGSGEQLSHRTFAYHTDPATGARRGAGGHRQRLRHGLRDPGPGGAFHPPVRGRSPAPGTVAGAGEL